MTAVREFNAAGPCIVRGELLRETARFYVYTDRFTGKEKKAGKTRMHTAPCTCCTDHERTVYPHGYMD